MTQADLKALLASGKMWVGHTAAIEQMDLVDMSDADHRERRIYQNLRSGFLVRFANGGLRSGFAVFHEAGWKRPETVSWFDGAPAEQDAIIPFSHAPDH